MGMGRICYFGFSVSYSNSFSEYLEGRNAELELALRSSEGSLGQGLKNLHDAVDAALKGDGAACAEAMDWGLGDLQECNDQLTVVGRSLVESRAALFERSAVDPADPLIARERHFAGLDYEAIHRELTAEGAVVPARVWWDDVADSLRRGGARAGLRLLDRQVRELQSHLRTFQAAVEAVRGLPLPELAPRLHGCSVAVARLMLGYARLNTTLIYFSILCERTSMLHDREHAATAAMAV